MAETLQIQTFQGVDYTLVLKQGESVEDLKCPICQELVNDPVLTSCGHLFCIECIKGEDFCSLCRERFSLFPDQRTKRQIRNLTVQCTHNNTGCTWQGNLGDFQKHLETSCSYEGRYCPLQCGAIVRKTELDRHMNDEYEEREVMCSHCGMARINFKRMNTDHFTACSRLPISCPAGCQECVPRGAMREHLNSCPEELVACRYAIFGCHADLKRKDLSAHMESAKDSHLEKAMEMLLHQSMELHLLRQFVVSSVADRQPLEYPPSNCPWLVNQPTSYPIPPWVIQMRGYQENKAKETIFYSTPIYSHYGGYKMCLKVCVNGYGRCANTHTSMGIAIMRGDHDDQLMWPFKGKISVTLLNQLQPFNHHTRFPWLPAMAISENVSARVVDGERAETAWGFMDFIENEKLFFQSESDCCYLMNDSLFFRIDHIEPTALNQ